MLPSIISSNWRLAGEKKIKTACYEAGRRGRKGRTCYAAVKELLDLCKLLGKVGRISLLRVATVILPYDCVVVV